MIMKMSLEIMRIFWILLLSVTFCICGCAELSSSPASSLDIGMSRDLVKTKIGEPLEIQRRGDFEGWKYFQLGFITDRLTYLWFNNDQLQGTTIEELTGLTTKKAKAKAFPWNRSPFSDKLPVQTLPKIVPPVSNSKLPKKVLPPTVRYVPRNLHSDCITGEWITAVSDGGEVLTLSDGSNWLVDDIDRIYSSLWLPITDIVVCDDKIINLDDNESVSATQIN